MKKRILFLSILMIAALVFTSALLAEESVNLHLVEGNGAGGGCFATGSGSIASIPDNDPVGACASFTLSGAPAGATVLTVSVDLAANHTWIGDLDFWLNSPDGGTLHFMDRPGYAGQAPGCCGDSSDLTDSSPISFFDGAPNDAEGMGVGAVVCQDDGLCDYFPNPDGDVGYVTFAEFAGENVDGTWEICATDGAGGDTGGLTLGTVNVECDAGEPPEIELAKTVGLDPHSCAASDSLDIPGNVGGSDVTYCYYMTNTGNVTVSFHTVEDSHLGTLLGPDFAADVGPGGSAWFTVTETITETTINTATWYITDGDTNVLAMAEATAEVCHGCTPTDVSLSSFGQDKAALSPLWLASLLLVIAGLGLALRRKAFNG